MAKRKAIPVSIRTEVFKRDMFTCQYCGRKAPEVVLEIDHIKPVAKGGTNHIMNLITSCFECNRGKGDRELSDTTVIDKERAQIEMLQERNEQLKMMLEWREGLLDIEDKEIDAVNNLIRKKTGAGFNEIGKKIISKLIKKYGLEEVLESTSIAIEQYYFTEEDWETMFSKIEKIAEYRIKSKEDPTIYIKNKLCKYAGKKFSKDFVRYELINMIDDCIIDEEKMFSCLKDAETFEEALCLLEERCFDWDAEWERVQEWLAENGDKKSG